MIFIALLACKPPVEAPADLSEASAYLYSNFNGDGEDGPEALPAGIASIEAWLTGLDMAADAEDRAATLTAITDADLAGATGPLDTETQVPVGVGGKVSHGMDDQFTMIMDPNQVCIASDSTVYQMQTFVEGGDCFGDGSCDRMSTTQEIKIDSLEDAWLDTVKDYVRVELEDGRVAVLSREWMPEQAISHTNEGASWDQLYVLAAWIPAADGDGVLRYNARWSSVTLTGVSDDFYATLLVNGIDEHYQNSDVFMDGGECKNDRNAPYDRE